MALNIKFAGDELCYSSIYGRGVYRVTEQNVQDPVYCGRENTGTSPLLENIITGEVFYMRLVTCNHNSMLRYKDRILNPPDRSRILWPVDLVTLSEEQKRPCSLYAANIYSASSSAANPNCSRAVLFPFGDYPARVDLDTRLSRVKDKTWRNPAVRKMAYQIITAIGRINSYGYVYNDFHSSRLLFDDSDDLFLDFSTQIHCRGELDSSDGKVRTMCAIKAGEYPLEFAEPAAVQGKIGHFDLRSQNYSLTALLFYLLFNRYAYDGRLLTDYIDDSVLHHYSKFKAYHLLPVFIFDPNDMQNALGAFDDELAIIELWNECPENIRKMFEEALKQENALRTVMHNTPTPQDWIIAFKKANWI